MNTSNNDLSNGWEQIADGFIANRNTDIGVKTLEYWSTLLNPGASVLDIGCGFGVPHAQVLINSGCNVYGIDASQTLIREFRKRFPMAEAVCETAESSNYFCRKFDGMIAIGLMFLLPEDAQLKLLGNVAKSLVEDGRLLFTSPDQVCTWQDILTGRQSRSLGKEVYVKELSKHGLSLVDEYIDEGQNHYFDFIKNDAAF